MADRPSVTALAEVRTATADASEVEFVSLPMSALARGERRMEAETYLTGGYGLRIQIESTLPFERLGDIADVWQPGRLKGTLVGPEHGLPFFTATQIFDIRPTPRKWVAPSRTPDLRRRFIEPGWLLVTCSGSVGDAILSYGPHQEAVISHDLLRVQVREERQRGYVYIFLRSHFGRTMLRSSRYGSLVKHLEPEHLHDVPVPTAPDWLYDELNALVNHIFELRERAFRLTLDAEGLYASQFPVTDEGEEVGYAIPASQIFGGRRRLDGQHYDPRVRGILAALEASGVEAVSLGSVTKAVFGVPRFKHVYRNHGIPYLDSEDIFKINPEIDKFIPEVTKKDASRYYVKRGWLLMASSGQLYGLNGSVVLADRWHEGKIVSNHVLRIVPRDIRPGYLAMALGHPILGRPMALRLAFGSEVPEIAPEDLRSIPIARLGDIEDQIAGRMEEASNLRSQADRVEDAAVDYLQRYLKRMMHGEHDGEQAAPFTREDFLHYLDPLMTSKREEMLRRDPPPRPASPTS